MYNNAGKSIKGIVQAVVSISIVLSVILGILIIGNTDNIGGRLIGILVAIMGSFIAWLGGLVLYAFGDMADRLKRIDEKLNGPELNGECKLDAPTAENGWICASCYKVNYKHHGYCAKCGVSQSWSNAEWEKKNK